MAALYAVTLEIAPDAEAAWLSWMKDHHIPEVLREPGFLSARLWKDTASASDGWARYVSQYELVDLAAVEHYVTSEAAKRLRADVVNRFGSSMRASRSMFSEIASFPAPVVRAG